MKMSVASIWDKTFEFREVRAASPAPIDTHPHFDAK